MPMMMTPQPDYIYWDGHIAKSVKNQNDKYMSSEMNMLIMYSVHHLSTEMEGKNL